MKSIGVFVLAEAATYSASDGWKVPCSSVDVIATLLLAAPTTA